MGSKLVRRVIAVSAACAGPLALAGFLLAGLPGGLGVLAGGGIALGNLWLLGRGIDRTAALVAGRRLPRLWGLGLGLRYLALFGTIVLLLRSGIHPVALIAGFSILPPVLIAYALRSAPEGS